MDSADAADLVAEISEERAEDKAVNRFRNRAALLIAILAAAMAIGGLGAGNATDDMIANNIHASDSWAFYQAKNLRQTAYEIAAEGIAARLAAPGGDPAERARLTAQLAEYRATIARYESEPDAAAPNDPLRGEGKRQLRARAQAYEAARTEAEARDGNFDMAEVFLQLALVLGSVAILAINRAILSVSLGLGLVGSALTVNGFMLLCELPF